MKNRIKLSLISVALLSSLHAKETQNQYTLETISVSVAQGTTLDKKDVTDSVTIITKEALEESRVTTLNEALNKLGGISMSQNGGAGSSTSMYVRGMDTKRLLVLIDGVRYNNPSAIGAAASFSQIMLYNVEQIEIIKGSQSGVWGSDATGGVINIITAKAKKGLGGFLNAEYGSFATKRSSMGASYATQDYDILISGSYYDTDGFSAVEPNQASADYGKRGDELGYEEDAYTNKSLNLKLGYNFSKNDRVEINVQSIEAQLEYDSSVYDYATGISTPTDDSLPNSDLTSSFHNFSYSHKDSLNDIKLQYNLSTFDRTYISTYGEDRYEASVKEIKLDDKITYMEDSFLRIGASYQKFEQVEITENTDKSYSATSAFLTNYNKLELLSDLNTIITESVRYDSYDEFDDSLTAKLGAKQFVAKEYYVSLNVGSGFNAPTLSQLYGQWGANPDLQPESSLTTDITIGSDTLWVTGFYNIIEDLIEYDMTTYAYVQTTGKSKFKGLELGYQEYYLNALGVNATYTYVKTENADGEELARRPKTQVDANIVYYMSEELDFGLNAQYIGERYDKANKKGAQTGKYTVANFVTNYQLNKYLALYGKINNIRDEYYQVVDGYATAERSYYLGLNAKY